MLSKCVRECIEKTPILFIVQLTLVLNCSKNGGGVAEVFGTI